MGLELLSSKIVVIEEEPRLSTLPVVASAVLGIVGKAQRGPLNTPTQVTSFEEYVRTFGDFVSGFEMPLAVRAFFLEGGRNAFVVRAGDGGLVAMEDFDSIPIVATAGSITGTEVEPFDLEPGDDLDIEVDGAAAQTATFNAAAASLESGTAELYDLDNGDTLTVIIDGGATQTITFSTGDFADIDNATAEEVAAVINNQIVGASASASSGGTKVTIKSDRRGTSSSVQVTGGSANADLGFSTVAVTGTGNVANIDAVTAAEAITVIEAAVTAPSVTVTSVGGAIKITSDTTGVSSSVQVLASSTADDEFGFDNALHSGSAAGTVPTLHIETSSVGAWGNNVRIFIRDASSGETDEFNLEVEVDGFVVERFPNLIMDPSTASNFVETVINHEVTGSLYITATALDTLRPANQTAGVFLSGGSDPTVTSTELIGGTTPTLTGIRALDTVDDVTLLAIPDGASTTVQNSMTTYAEVTRNRQIVCIFDPPAASTAAGIVTHAESLTSSEQWALYWPRIKVPNPLRRVFGDVETITTAVSGHIAGICARNDANKLEGPFANPAGVEDGRIFGAVNLETDEVLREEKRDLVFPKRVNPVMFVPGNGIFLDGARTGKGDGNFPSVGERRGVSFVEFTLKRGLLFAKNKANTEELRERVDRTVTTFLLGLTAAGAFATKDPDRAFFVDVSDQLNNAQVRAQNKLLVRIGLATAKPAEFIVLLVSQDTRALEEQLLARSG
jgi:hypothetical protein